MRATARSADEIAAVVLAHNPGPGLAGVLDAVAAQTSPPGIVVVVDNASTDGTRTLLQERTGIRTLLLPENLGVGAGHNRGWASAREWMPGARAVWVLEHDTVPEPDCLAALMSAWDEHETRGAPVGAVLPAQVGSGEMGDRRRPARSMRRLTFNGPVIPVGVLDHVGPLREDFVVGQEDREFALRMTDAGYVIVKDFRARVHHPNKRYRGQPSVRRSYYSVRNDAFMAVHVRHERLARLRLSARTVGAVVRVLVTGDRRASRVRARVRATRDGIRGDLGLKHYGFLDA